jgi:hypothetical protein
LNVIKQLWEKLCVEVKKKLNKDANECLRGWTITITQRKNGQMAGKWDPLYFNEEGLKFRSLPEVLRFVSTGEAPGRSSKSGGGDKNVAEAKKKKKKKKKEGNNIEYDDDDDDEDDDDEEEISDDEVKVVDVWEPRNKKLTAHKLSTTTQQTQMQQQSVHQSSIIKEQQHQPLKRPMVHNQNEYDDHHHHQQQQQQQFKRIKEIPQIERAHDCKNFINVVSSEEKRELIKRLTGATCRVDEKFPTRLIIHGSEAQVRNGIARINSIIENNRKEQQRIINIKEQAAKNRSDFNVNSLISAVKGKDEKLSHQQQNNNNIPSMNSNMTHISPPNSKSMSLSPTTLADAWVPEIVRTSIDGLVKNIREHIRNEEDLSKRRELIRALVSEAVRIVRKHGDVAADKLFEALKDVADEDVEIKNNSSKQQQGGGISPLLLPGPPPATNIIERKFTGGSEMSPITNDSAAEEDSKRREIERKLLPLVICSFILESATADVVRLQIGPNGDDALKAKENIVINLRKYLIKILRGIMRGESQLSQDVELRKRAYDVAKKTQLKCIAVLDEWSNNTEYGDLSKHETIQPAKDIMSELRRRAKDRIKGKVSAVESGGASGGGGHRLIDRVQRPEARIKIDSDLAIAMKGGDGDDAHDDLALGLENQYGGFSGAQLGDFSALLAQRASANLSSQNPQSIAEEEEEEVEEKEKREQTTTTRAFEGRLPRGYQFADDENYENHREHREQREREYTIAREHAHVPPFIDDDDDEVEEQEEEWD